MTLVAPGNCTLRAAQAGNANYLAAATVDRSFTVDKKPQTITFNAPADRPLGSAPFTVSATATSALAVSFASTTTSICTVSGTTVTLVATGNCSLRATQAGNATWAAAPEVVRSFAVGRQLQTITFPAPGAKLWGSPPVSMSATASSGLPVVFFVQTPTVCQTSGTAIALLRVGTCIVQANQAGDATYAPASASQAVLILGPVEFGPMAAFAPPIGSGGLVDLAVADFNADGRPDVVAADDSGAGVPFASTANAGLTAGAGVRLDTAAVTMHDFNGDGKMDVAGKVASLGNGTGGFTQVGQSSIADPGASRVVSGDFDEDGLADIAIAHGSYLDQSNEVVEGQEVHLHLGRGDGTFQGAATRTYYVGLNPQGLAAGDFNGDGHLDLVTANHDADSLSILLGTGTGTFGTPTALAAGTTPGDVTAADFNGDGKLDLAVVNRTVGSLSIYTGRGTGTFNARTDHALGTTLTSVAVADLNGDGVLDVASLDDTDLMLVTLLGVGDGTFIPGASISLPLLPTALATADLNLDGKVDLIIAGSAGVGVLLNVGALSPLASIVTQAGTPQSAVAGAPFAIAMAALVRNAGGLPLAGQEVTFMAPGSGPSGIFAGGLTVAQAFTNASGVATAPAFTAGNLAGAFAVVASIGTANATFALTVTSGAGAAPIFITGPPPGAALGLPYAYAIAASGSPPPAYSVLASALPTGLGLDPATGLISGTPTIAATYIGQLTASNGMPPDAVQTFNITVSAAAQAISFPAIPNQTFGAPPIGLDATATSGLLVSFASSTPSVCTVSGSSVTLLSGGICTIQASQSGSAVYSPAPIVSQSFTVAKAAQAITFPALLNRQLGSGTVALSASASSTLAVTFTSLTTSICTVSGSIATLVTTGICTIRAAQSGNGAFLAANPVSQSFTVKPAGSNATPTLSWLTPANGATYVAPAIVPLVVSTEDTDGSVSRVEYYSGNTLLATVQGPSFAFAWTAVAAGTYSLTAKAYDDLGSVTTSNAAVVTVAASGASVAFGSAIVSATPNAWNLSPRAEDVDADGQTDLYARFLNEHKLLKGNGAGAFTPVTPTLNGHSGTCPASGNGPVAVLGNFGGDARPDLLTVSYAGCVAIDINGSGGSTVTGGAYSVGFTPAFLYVVDLDQDAKQDAVTLNADGTIAILHGNGDGTLQAPMVLTGSPNAIALGFGDVDGNGKPDIVALDVVTASATIFLNSGGGFASGVVIPMGRPQDQISSLAVADVTADGKADIVVTAQYAGAVNVAVSLGNGTFLPWFAYPAGATPYDLAITDLNADGKPDIAVSNLDSTATVTVLLGNGNGSFQSPIDFALPDPIKLIGSDVTGDGKPDLVASLAAGIATLVNLTGTAVQAPVITSGPPPEAIRGAPYTFQFTATGTPPPSFSLQGSLGNGGLTLSASGVLSTADPEGLIPGVYRAKVVANNGVAPEATQDFVVVVRPPAAQVIDFPPLGDVMWSGPCHDACGPTLWISPTTQSSGAWVTLVSLTPSVCTVDFNGTPVQPIYVHTVGRCTLRAEQWSGGGGGLYGAAAAVDRSFDVVASPPVSITSPLDGAAFVASANITLRASAQTMQPGHSFLRVEYSRDGVIVGSATGPPFEVTWSNAPLGTYGIVAKVIQRDLFSDQVVTTATSAPITVHVLAQPDTTSVILTAPTAGAVFPTSPAITLAATAASPGGSVTKVDFFSNNLWIGSSSTPPYTFSWTERRAGPYALSARATSNQDATVASPPVSVTLVADTSLPLASYRFDETWLSPVVAMDTVGGHWARATGAVGQASAPAGGAKPDTCKAATFAGGYLDVDALPLAADPGSTATVAFWMYWNGADGAAPLAFATQSLLFAASSFGFSTGSGDVYGIASTGLANGWHHVVAEFTHGGVASNRLYLDGVPQALSQLVGSPNNGNATIGPRLRIGARIAASPQPFSGQLDDVQVFHGGLSPAHVAALRAATSPCGVDVVRLRTPTSGESHAAPATLRLTAEIINASGNWNVAYYDGASLLGYGTQGPGNLFVWNGVPAGAHTITARLTGPSGATSAPVLVDVLPVSGLSTGGISSPSPGATLYSDGSVNFRSSATPAPGYTIAWVEYWWNGVEIGWSRTTPYLFAWKHPPPGTHTIEVRIVDTAGFVSLGTPLTITVVAGSPSIVYYVNDPAGSPIAATDQAGHLLWTETYAPYGARQVEGGDTWTKNGLWFTGQPTEEATGLSQFGARWYNPAIGRFYSVDPVAFTEGNPKSFNRYGYGNNNPYRFADPNGRSPVDIAFLAYDVVALLEALSTGSGVGDALVGVAISAVGVAVPIPGTGLAIKSARAAEAVAARSGWRAGDDIYAATRDGAPSWSTVRSRYWKNEAASPGAAERWGAENAERMRRGQGPQRYNADKGGMETMELSHEPIPARSGGTNLVPRWPQDHAAVDPFRRPGY